MNDPRRRWIVAAQRAGIDRLFEIVDDEPTVEDLDDLCAHGVHILLCDDDRCLEPGAPTEPVPAIDLSLPPGARLALPLQCAGALPGLLSPTTAAPRIGGIACRRRRP